MNRQKDSNSNKVIRYAALIFIVCFLLWVALGAVVYLRFSTWDDRGKVGDMFGAANALFSGLALAGVVLALLLQREQLALQHQESLSNREGLESTIRSQQNSEALLSAQVAAISQAAQLTSVNTLINLYQQKLRAARDPLTRDPAREAEYGQRIENLTRKLQELTENSLLTLPKLNVRGANVPTEP